MDRLSFANDKARALLAQPSGPWVNPLAAEVSALRRLLFSVYTAPGMGYTDDGELQDGTVHPSIDFLRMTPEQIQEAIRRREGKGGRLGELAAEVEALKSALTECADDLEAEVNARASGELPRRIERDLEPVRKARALLAQPAGPWVNPLAAELEKLRADAERYWALRRVLREDMTDAQYDACIDAARGAAQRGEEV